MRDTQYVGLEKEVVAAAAAGGNDTQERFVLKVRVRISTKQRCGWVSLPAMLIEIAIIEFTKLHIDKRLAEDQRRTPNA